MDTRLQLKVTGPGPVVGATMMRMIRMHDTGVFRDLINIRQHLLLPDSSTVSWNKSLLAC